MTFDVIPSKDMIMTMLMTGEITKGELREKNWFRSIARCAVETSQPRGGYVRPRLFETVQLPNGDISDLNATENIASYLISLAVDYLTRYAMGEPLEKAFDDAIKGAKLVGDEEKCKWLLSRIVHVNDDVSVSAAAMLTGYAASLRVGSFAYKSVDGIVADKSTCENIRKMIMRMLYFFEHYGPKMLQEFTFEGGYTGAVSSGDCECITDDTIWNFICSKYGITSKQTLQLLIQWRMGLHSIHMGMFQRIKYLGIFNLKTNVIYRLPVDIISDDVIVHVERDIIRYD